MCGINGFNWNDQKLILDMNNSIRYRGPDDSGVFINDSITLGQQRLSILDLTDAGHQPMFYSKKKGAFSENYKSKFMSLADLGIVFNGEIYNFLDIKDELSKKGYIFSTKCDTEVILASYIEWGFDCVHRFDGMWAFVIYDKSKDILFCSRDRYGVKPFYYFFDGQDFVFSSELKAIIKNKVRNKKELIKKEAIEFYFSMGYIPAPYSIYENIYKLKAGYNLVFSLKKKTISKSQYYEIPDFRPENDKKKLVKEGRELLADATRLRLISDVPVGAFLSGGLDSSSVVGAMSNFVDLKNLNTFSIGFEGKYDESYYINTVKDFFNTKHFHYYFRERDFENLVENYSYIYDEPFGDYSGFPAYTVSKIARSKVTVALSGDGGDEVFSGYPIHSAGAKMDFLRKIPRFLRVIISKLPFKKNLDKANSLYVLREACKVSLGNADEFYAKALSDVAYKPEVYKDWMTKTLDYCLKKANNSLAEAFRIHDLLFNTLQNNFLVKVDRASMQHNLEVRSPFLDYRFIEFSQRIPTKWKVNLRKTKILMREIIKGIVPNEIVNRGKQGFEPPLDKWILKNKYSKILEKGLEILKGLNKNLYEFYKNIVLKENSRLYTTYKIRLFLFVKWWERWI